MNALIGAPLQRVGELLHVQLLREIAEAGENERVNVSLAVAVPARNARGPRQPLGENGRAIKAPVAVRVFEQFHTPEFFVAPLRIVAHLDHVEPPVFIESHRHGIDDERLRGHQLDVKAWPHRASRRGLLRRRRRHAREVFARHGRLGESKRRGEEEREKAQAHELL